MKFKMRLASVSFKCCIFISVAKFVSTKTAGGFVGYVYGMYATSSGEQSCNAASFKYLKYSGNDQMYP
ncbi:MAG: hypothetical protein ABIN01_13025 [Ferruginibacter sp.]